ncbi:TonB-dependent receptor [Salinimicrobium marinum]|nr:TonB-dependent receptor [Salinimicrobium marinum]
MKILHFTISYIVLMLFSNGILAQDARVFGKVESQSGETISGVTLLLKGTGMGTMTNLDGDYEINNLKAGKYQLQVRFLGYESREFTLDLSENEERNLDVVLQDKTEEIEVVTVLGKSVAGQVREQSYMVSAISTKDLYNSTSDAQQVLNRVPGVRILEEGGLGSDMNFTLNGFSGDQVKFFMDGIPMDHFGSALGLNNIPVNSIDRIEVYKGVVPVWLGTDALGGAVNIITNQGANFLDASYSLGSFNTHRASVNGAYTQLESGFTFRGNINYNYSDNDYKVWVPIREGNNIIDTTEVERFHDRYRSGSAKIETGLVNKSYADQLLVGVLAAANDKEVQHGATMKRVFGGITRNSESIVPTLKYSKEDLFTPGLDVSFYTAYNMTKSEVIDTLSGVTYNWLGEATYIPGSTDGELRRTFTTMDDNDFSSRLNAGFEFNEQHSVAFNYSYSHFSRDIFDAENPDRIENMFPKSLGKQVGGLAYKFDPNKKWSTTLFGKYYNILAEGSKQYDFGLETQRIDSFEASQDNFGYGLATSYFLLPQLQLKASYEHTYRMPTATEMFGDGLFTNPNPDLGPEQSNNFNFGAGYNMTIKDEHFLSVGSSFIYRNAQDLIYQVVTVASPQTRFDNLSETRTLGVEGNINYEWGNFFQLGGNVTYQDITDQADFVYNESYTNTGYQRNFQKGFRLPNTPYFFGNATAGFTFKNVFSEETLLNVLYRYNYVEEYFLSWAELGSRDSKKIIPTQSSHDLELSYSLNNGKYNISFEVRNLTNARLYDKYFLQKPGRAFYLKLRYAL